ncbi:histidinol-phosphatase (PHP family), partial [Tremellales sp. Uapishka_1]
MPHSHHSHSGQFCRHAKDTLDEVVQQAIHRGFEVFGLSEHGPRYRLEDLFPEEVSGRSALEGAVHTMLTCILSIIQADLTVEDLKTAYESFLSTAAALRAKYASQISLLVGIETDHITPLDLSGLEGVLARHPEIDYIVGSVHHVNGVSIDFDGPNWIRSVRHATSPDMGATMVETPSGLAPFPIPHDQTDEIPSKTDLEPFFCLYLDKQFELLQRFQPEVVGHFDLCLLFTPQISLRDEGFNGVWERVERNIRFVVDYGGLFEMNAAALRKGWKTSYPSKDVLSLIQSLGGRVCLSDDSHGVSYVGMNYLPMRDYLQRMHLKEIWYLVREGDKKDGDEKVGNRGKVVARRMEQWDQHAFWDGFAAGENSR